MPVSSQLELRLLAAAAAVFLDQLRVGKCGLRILVERLHVGMRGRGIEVEITLLDVLAVIALGAGEAEQALLQDRVAAVPQRQREAQPAFAVADAQQPVLAPAIGAAARVVVRKVIPARRRRRNSPRARCPIGARKDRVPSASSFSRGAASSASRASSAIKACPPRRSRSRS